MDLCPLCLENNKKSILINIGVDIKLLVCESDECIYMRNEGESTLYEITNDNKSNLPKNKDLKLFPSSSSDLECDLSTSDSDNEYSAFTNKSKLHFSRYKIALVQRHLTQIIKDSDKMDSIFNWFGFPLMLKFHMKMCYFLVIHLDLFNTKNHQIQELKELYCQCKGTACKMPSRLVSLISYKFVKFLFDQHHVFKLANFESLDMYERILRSINKFISAMDDNYTYKSVYNLSESCQSCGYTFSYLKEDFAIKVMNDFEYSDNYAFKYLSNCRKCFASGMLQVNIKIERLSNFIFIVCPEGVNKTVVQLNEIIFKKQFDSNLKLQAIIELRCPALFGDLPEKEPKFEEFILKNACKPKVEFRIHFRNTVGWYCVDTYSGICVDPINESDILISPDQVRILIYGELNNPNNCHTNEFYPPIYKVLEDFKKSPIGFVNYPSEIIKYWMILFKYRDYCLQKSDYSKSFLTKISTKITSRLNAHLKRRQNRIKKKLNQSMIDKNECKTSFSSSDENAEVENNLNEEEEKEEEEEKKEVHDKIISEEIITPKTSLKIEKSFNFENCGEASSTQESINTATATATTLSNIPAIIKNIKSEKTANNNFNISAGNNILNVFRAKTKIVNSNNALLDELIGMKKRKLDERNEDL